MGDFTDKEIHAFITAYQERVDKVKWLLEGLLRDPYSHTRHSEIREEITDKKVIENIELIQGTLEALKQKNIYRFNCFKDETSQEANSNLNQYFTDGLAKIDSIITHADDAKRWRGGRRRFEGIEYAAAGLIAAIAIIGILGWAGLMPIAWIALPIILAIGVAIWVGYEISDNSKVRKETKNSDIESMKSSIKEFENYLRNEGPKVDGFCKIIEEVVRENVNLANVRDPFSDNPPLNKVPTDNSTPTDYLSSQLKK